MKMKEFETIDEIFAANDRIYNSFAAAVSTLSPEQSARFADDASWTVAQIVEHVALVEEGAMRICTKLLGDAAEAGRPFDGKVRYSGGFLAQAVETVNEKLAAPERVHPNSAWTIDQSLEKIRDSRAKLNALRPRFEQYDCSEEKFPHPYFGPLSAIDWLTLAGGHMTRHTKQIERILIDRINIS